MSQTNQILDLLESGNWICVSDMLKLYCVDYRRRLCDLKDKGYLLESRKCQQHSYHKGISKEWRLMTKPNAHNDIIAPIKPLDECCYSFKKFKVHSQECRKAKENTKILEKEKQLF